MSFLLRSILVPLVSVALLMPASAGAVAHAEPVATDTATPAAQADPVPRETSEASGKAAPAPQFSIAVMQRDPARLGGSGVVDVVLTRRGVQDRVVRDVQARVSVESGTRIAKAAGKGWTCPTPRGQARTLTCTLDAAVPATASPAPITVDVAVALGAQSRTPLTDITATATWIGDPAARTSPLPKPWLVQDSGPLDVHPALDAQLSSPAGMDIAILTRGDAESRQVVIAGTIAGIEGGQVTAEWFVKSGPKVSFLNPQTVRDAKGEVNQIVEYADDLKGKATSVIGLRVTSDNRTVTRTLPLTVRASRILGNVDGRDSRIAQLAKASLIPIPFEDYVDADDDHIAIDGPSGPQQPGSQATLSVRSKSGVAIESLAWYSIDQNDRSTFVTDARTATFAVPSQPGDARTIQVAAVMANGETHEEGFILYALDESELRMSVRDVGATEDDTTANLAIFCSLAQNVLDQRGAGTENEITIDPPGGVQLAFTPKQADISKAFMGGECKPDGQMTISGGAFKHPSAWTFNSVEAKVDPTGLTVTTLGWVPPAILQKIFFGKLKIEWKGTLTSTLTDGQWGLLGGTVDMQPVTILGQKVVYGPEFIPLPGDWSVKKDGTKLLFLNKADGAPADNTLRITEEVTGPKDGKAVITADAVSGSLDNVAVEVANITLGDNGQGDSFVANGSGQLNFNSETAQRKITLKVECYRDKVLSDNCELVERLTLRSFNVILADDTISLTAEAAFRYADDQVFGFAVEGLYVDSKTWTMTGSTTNTWNLGQGLSMKSLVGTIERRPRTGEADKTDLFIDVRGTLEGLTFGSAVTVDSLDARVTNQCAAQEEAQGTCVPTEMRLQVDAQLQATIPGSAGRTPLSVRAAANLSTLKFRFEGTAEDVAIGPQGMQVTKARFILTNETTNTCRPKGAPEPTGSGYTTQIAGQVRLLNNDFTVNAQFNSDGYCLWGNSGPMALGSEGLRATSGLLVYSNFAGGAELVIGGGSPAAVPAGKIQLSGAFDLPASVRDFLGTSGEVTYEANVATNLTSADFKLTLTTADAIVLYEQTQASAETDVRSKVTMSDVGLEVSYDVNNPKASLEVFANGELILPRQDDRTVASVTPLGVTGSFGFDGAKVSFEIAASVNTKAGPVQDAFGQPGLTIRELAVSLGLSAVPVPSPTVKLNADATLPAGWGKSIGIKAGAPIRLAVALDLNAPCLNFSIGEEDKANRKLALDLANLGVISAYYFRLLLAPAGCTLPSGSGTPLVIKPGYAFAFDGFIMGSPTRMEFEVGLGDGLKIKTVLDLEKPLDLYAAKLSNFQGDAGPKVALDIDTKASKYDIDLDAALEIGKVEYNVGIMVAVKGSLRTSGDMITATLQGHAKGALGPISVEIPEKRTVGKKESLGKPGLMVDLKIPKAGKEGNPTVNAGAQINASVVGLTLTVAADLNYSDGQLVELKAIVDTKINIYVAMLQARVQFDLCQGTLSPIKQDGSGSQCTTFAKDKLEGASPSIRVGVTGRYRILWWGKDYLWQAYDSEGKPGGPPAPSEPTALELATQIPEGVGNPEVSGLYVYKNHDVFARRTLDDRPTSPTVYLKVLEGRAKGDIPACDRTRVGAQAWEPTADDSNPSVEPLNPYPMTEGESCAMRAKAAIYYSSNPVITDVDIVCEPDRCFVPKSDAGILTAGLMLSPRESTTRDPAQRQMDARAQTFTGLTTPPGFIPPGGILQKEGPNPAAVEGWDGRSELRADTFTLNLVNGSGKSVWSFGGKPNDASVASHFELRGTEGSVRLIQFTLYRQGNYASSRQIIVPVKKPAAGSKVEPMLVVSDGMFTVYDGRIGADSVIWGVKKDGSCFYNKDRVGSTLAADFCRQP